MKYWIYINNEKSGPFSIEMLREKTIPPTTLVWCDGMATWKPANEIPELAQLYKLPPFPPLPPLPPLPNEQKSIEKENPELSANEIDIEIGDNNEIINGDEAKADDAEISQLSEESKQEECDVNEIEINEIPVSPADKCEHQTKVGMPPHPDVKCPPTYLVWAILVTLCCCQIFGVIAVVYAANVKSKYNRGDVEGAIKNSELAALWVILAFVVGLVTMPLQSLISML